jgi:hypothetical protein
LAEGIHHRHGVMNMPTRQTVLDQLAFQFTTGFTSGVLSLLLSLVERLLSGMDRQLDSRLRSIRLGRDGSPAPKVRSKVILTNQEQLLSLH